MLFREKSNSLHRAERVPGPGLPVASPAHERGPCQGKHTRCWLCNPLFRGEERGAQQGETGICLNALQLKSILGSSAARFGKAAKIWSRGWLMGRCRTFVPGRGDKLGPEEKAEGLQHLSGAGPGNPTQPLIRLSARINPTGKDAAAAKLCLVFED